MPLSTRRKTRVFDVDEVTTIPARPNKKARKSSPVRPASPESEPTPKRQTRRAQPAIAESSTPGPSTPSKKTKERLPVKSKDDASDASPRKRVKTSPKAAPSPRSTKSETTAASKQVETPRKTRSPLKESSQISPHVVKTPSFSANTAASTPSSSRRSNRVRHLPVDQILIDKTPDQLKSVLVGWHDPEALEEAKRRQALMDSGDADSSNDEGDEHDDADNDGADEAMRDMAAGDEVLDRQFPTESITQLVDGVLSNLSGLAATELDCEDDPTPKDPLDFPCLPGYESWERAMRYSMANVVREGLGSCFLAIGARGIGKSLLAERCVGCLERAFGAGKFIAVHLNGFIHTTDSLALRSIAQQINFTSSSDEESDTLLESGNMAALLALLEPKETTKTRHQPIILILDEFDLFALHPRQSFLYCLLDIVQGNRRKAGLGIIGLSARTDCLSMLEKRVKSRCQSQVYQIAPPNTWETYLSMVRRLLSPKVDDQSLAAAWTNHVNIFINKKGPTRFLKAQWNLNGCNPSRVLSTARDLFEIAFRWNHETADAHSRLPLLDASVVRKLENVKRSNMLDGCTVLELYVCVAAKHVKATTDNSMNIEELYHAYKEHHARTSGAIPTRAFPPSAFAMAFDDLVSREVLIPASSKPALFVAPCANDKFRKYRFVPWAASVDEAVSKRPDAPERLKRWCTHWSD